MSRCRSGPRGLAALVLAGLVTACAEFRVDPLPEPVRPPRAEPSAAVDPVPPPPPEAAAAALRTARTPGVVIQRTVAEGIADRLGEGLAGDPIRVSFHDLPLVSFINEVFGNALGMSFVISPGLRQQTDLVTLKLTEPLAPGQLFATARRVLREYGVDVVETEEGILNFVPGREAVSRDVPLFVSGRALPEVPPGHRTIFQLVPLRVVSGAQVTGWLQEAFDSQDLDVIEDPDRNALLLKGSRNMLALALAMIEVLDQPLLRGRYGLIIEPVFMSAQDLADTLQDVLGAEGYAVSAEPAGPAGAVILLTLANLDKVVVFAADQAALDHVSAWARTLDARTKETIESAVFTYEVLNTQAEELTDTLNQMLASGLAGEAPPEAADAEPDPATPASPAARPAAARIVVDTNRNLLLFRGSGREWAELRGVVEQLDRSVPSVLVEVLIAEVTLADQEKSGFEFLLDGSIDGRGLTAGTIGALGLGASGLTVALDSAGQTLAALNLFYSDDRVTIRSRPRLVVKSGETASIDVGNEIPVVTRISEDLRQVGGVTNVLQDVTYRKTGVQLEIKPVVQANGLVDIQISQQLSEARPTAATSLAGSPTILNRQISTSLTLKDGGSLLLGGLISGSQSAGQAGVPVLGELPVVGRLFRADTIQADRTELLIMVTPYVIADHEEGWRLTRRIREQLRLHEEYGTQRGPSAAGSAE